MIISHAAGWLLFNNNWESVFLFIEYLFVLGLTTIRYDWSVIKQQSLVCTSCFENMEAALALEKRPDIVRYAF